MRTALTLVFVAVACLVSGGLAAHIGATAKVGKVEAQRDKSLRLAEEYKDLLDRTEKAAAACVRQVGSLKTFGDLCVQMTQQALDERDACRKEHSGRGIPRRER